MTDDNKTNPFYYSMSGDKEEDEKLLEPMKYILQIPGKKIRSKLTKAFNYWLKIPDDKVQAIDDIVTMIHNSSLLQHTCLKDDLKTSISRLLHRFDDIIDNSTVRRGNPVAHSVYGIASTMNAANYVLFIALERVVNLHQSAATKIYLEELLDLHRGQGMEVFWINNVICPTEADYNVMILRKSGTLFKMVLRLMKLFSTYKEDFSTLTTILGLYFQIRNDYCNLWVKEYTNDNSYCEDLTEGKFSFPIIHALTSNPDDRQIINILKQRTKDIELKRHCVKLLEKFGSFNYTRNALEKLESSMRTEIKRLGGNPLFIEILDELNCITKDVSKDLLTGTF